MVKRTKRRAEELLAEERFSEELMLQEARDGLIAENEVMVAQTIHSYLLNSVPRVNDQDKEETKEHIKFSVRKLNLKREIVRWSAVAAILLTALVTAVFFLQDDPTSDIAKYALTLSDIKPGANTHIILQNGGVVQVQKASSHILYDAKGENIQIDSEQKVEQKIDNSQSVFNTVIVPYGKRTQITLSEGTKVWLNSGSKLVYPAHFADNKREVFMEGEAVFEVTPMREKPFVVNTKDFDIKVLGTVFNVSVYPDDNYSSAILETGKIEIVRSTASIFSKEKLEITPGSIAIFDRSQKIFEQHKVDSKKYLSWREGYLIFNSEKLGNILKKLSRYYNIEMVVHDTQLKEETYSGYLDLKNSPEEVLSVICQTIMLTYTIDNEKIIINTK
jgi:ferric-dicitrate binding protein FerR (iron transport regulator)